MPTQRHLAKPSPAIRARRPSRTANGPHPTVADAARLARSAIAARVRGRSQVPKLRVASRQPHAPTVWMICPDWDKPTGGIRVQYRAVDSLNAAGISAAIVHHKAGFACTWFEHETRIVPAPDVVVGEHDVIVVPEVYGASIGDLPKGIRQVIFNQNAYNTLDSLMSDDGAAAPYSDNPDLTAVLVVSQDNAELLRYVFPAAPVLRVRVGLDEALYHPPDRAPANRIAYMPRRRRHDVAEVLRLLEIRGVFERWEPIAIDGCSEAGVADALRSSRVFLSFSEREGFGLPPCEALACGCIVVGFDGFAGREFFRDPFAVAVPDGDVVGMARETERVLRRIEDRPSEMAAASAAGSRFIRDAYPLEATSQDLVDIFTPLVRSTRSPLVSVGGPA
jgi:hypothetical protein